jgi:hypothetical protein
MQLPKSILNDPAIRKLYDDFKKKQMGKGKRMSGKGLWEDFNDFLKRSKIISNVGGVVVPLASGALGGFLGSAFTPVGSVTGASLGAAAGKSAVDYVKSLGYGKMRGGDSRLVINPIGQRLGQKRMMGKGTTALNYVAPDNAKVKF